MRRMKDKIEATVTNADEATHAVKADKVSWTGVQDKPSTYTPSAHTHTKDQVGLSNVDNTADKDKSVKSATLAEMANSVKLNWTNDWLKFSGTGIDSDTPAWVFGGRIPGASTVQMFDPSSFRVNYAQTAGTALTAKNLPYSITYEGSYVGTCSWDSVIYDFQAKNYATQINPIRTTLSKEYDIVVFLDAGPKGRWNSDYDETCREKYAFLRLMNVGDKFTESYVVMSALTSEWTRGLSGPQTSDNREYGPVIQYGASPKASIKYRKNGTVIERYWTREVLASNGGVEVGSASSIQNGAHMLLDRAGRTYHVFGIDIDHRFFATPRR